jgi:hypothetical protein
MRLRAWILRTSVATLLLVSAVGGGWKWPQVWL